MHLMSLEMLEDATGQVMHCMMSVSGGAVKYSAALTVIAHFLVSWRHFAHDGSAGQLEIGSLGVCLSGHEEEFLFESDEGLHSSRVLDSE